MPDYILELKKGWLLMVLSTLIPLYFNWLQSKPPGRISFWFSQRKQVLSKWLVRCFKFINRHLAEFSFLSVLSSTFVMQWPMTRWTFIIWIVGMIMSANLLLQKRTVVKDVARLDIEGIQNSLIDCYLTEGIAISMSSHFQTDSNSRALYLLINYLLDQGLIKDDDRKFIECVKNIRDCAKSVNDQMERSFLSTIKENLPIQDHEHLIKVLSHHAFSKKTPKNGA